MTASSSEVVCISPITPCNQDHMSISSHIRRSAYMLAPKSLEKTEMLSSADISFFER